MTVYLVPVGDRRYQLYVEVAPDADVAPAAPAGSGWMARQIHRFRATLAEAEEERLRRESGEPERSSGLWNAIMRRIAETVAEQRLLWHLRHQTAAEVAHPADIDGATALREVRAEFSRDEAKHRRWMLIDGAIVAVTGPLFFFVPGPNVVSWYFTFRAVAHFLSWRGARKGQTSIDVAGAGLGAAHGRAAGLDAAHARTSHPSARDRRRARPQAPGRLRRSRVRAPNIAARRSRITRARRQRVSLASEPRRACELSLEARRARTRVGGSGATPPN